MRFVTCFSICAFWLFISAITKQESIAQEKSPTKDAVIHADTIYTNGKIVTVDKNFSLAQAIAIKGDRVLAVGTNQQIQKLAGTKTSTVDLKGKFVMPGMIDCHCHPDSLGKRGLKGNDWFNAGGTKNFDELVARVEKHVKTLKPGKWIIGGGWNQEFWPRKKLPIHDKLSAVSPNQSDLLLPPRRKLSFRQCQGT